MRLTTILVLLVCAYAYEGRFVKRKTINKPEPLKTENDSKKQDMAFNEEEHNEEVNEGPVGKVQGGGVEGLGGEMNGYPAGMGAGAEPLGAFENEDDSPPGTNTLPQSLGDEKNFAESELHDGNMDEMKMKAPAVSMSNTLEDIDNSVNIQGDGEIGKYVRNSQRSATAQQDGTGAPSMIGLDSKDPPFTGGESEGVEIKGGEETPSKRRLTKQKSKRKKNAWKKPFKQLQQKKR